MFLSLVILICDHNDFLISLYLVKRSVQCMTFNISNINYSTKKKHFRLTALHLGEESSIPMQVLMTEKCNIFK